MIVSSDTIKMLFDRSQEYRDYIIAPVVVDYSHPDVVWWAGSRWEKIYQNIPLLWTSRYLFKRGTTISKLPDRPYTTSEAHGRAVLVPRNVFEKIGLYDADMFPHYGADTDFSFRAAKHGFLSIVVPDVHVCLLIKNTGMKVPDTFQQAFLGYWSLLTKRKNGQIMIVWWRLLKRHVPIVSAVFSFVLIMLLNTYRYWQSALCQHLRRK